MAGLFAQWQPQYAKHGIATFPVRDKRPSVSSYHRMGIPASCELAKKRGDADAFGFVCGARSRITVIDIDSPDERLLSEAENRFGTTPLVIRSGSGNHQAWYRHNGEGRKIRPYENVPIDILGGGFVVAPPSRVSWGEYSLIRGSLDDLTTLPPLRPQKASAAAPGAVTDAGGLITKGRRNDALWRACMAAARDCRDITDLMRKATEMNEAMFYEPLPDDEVLKIVASAWAKDSSGENWFGRGGRIILRDEQIDRLCRAYPDALILLTLLKRYHWEEKTFVIANQWSESIGMPRKRLAAARSALVTLGEIEQLRAASPQHGPALYRFKGGRNRPPI